MDKQKELSTFSNYDNRFKVEIEPKFLIFYFYFWAQAFYFVKAVIPIP